MDERRAGTDRLKPRGDDHPRLQRVVDTLSMARVVSAVATTFAIDENRIRHGRGGVPRMIAGWIAWNEAMLTQRDIAAGLRLRSAGHVANLVRECDEELAGNPMLQEGIDRCVSTVRGKNWNPKA